MANYKDVVKNRAQSKSCTQGFSLIELMVTIGIMAVLAAIAMPSFMRYLAKAKRAEAYANLYAIYAAEKAYWAENGTYSNVLSGAGGIGWKPEGYSGGGAQENFYYTYGFPGSEGTNYVTGKLLGSSSNLGAGYAHKDSFLAVAVAEINGEGKPDILTIDQNKNIKLVQSALD
jgi:prepilin-type N-terminal cleavage/methylation domain-containing protein